MKKIIQFLQVRKIETIQDFQIILFKYTLAILFIVLILLIIKINVFL